MASRTATERTVLPAQRGIALVVVMLFLVLLAGVSIWGVRQSLHSEQVSRNQLDHEAARQAAEAALRDAERDLLHPGWVQGQASCVRAIDEFALDLLFTADCRRGLCHFQDEYYRAVDWSKTVAGEPWWPTSKGGRWNNNFAQKPGRSPVTQTNCDFSGGVPLGTFTGFAPLKGVSRQPEYLIEFFWRKKVRMNALQTRVVEADEGRPGPMYRITARGFGYSERTQVVLQTIVFP